MKNWGDKRVKGWTNADRLSDWVGGAIVAAWLMFFVIAMVLL